MTAPRQASSLAMLALAWVASCAGSSPRTTPPQNPGVAAADEEAVRASPPPAEPTFQFNTPQPYAATLSNGMRLVVFERHTLHIVAAELVVRGGGSALSHQSPALMRLIANTLLSGTARQTESQVYLTMTMNMIDLSPHAAGGWFGVSMRALSSRFDRALELLREVALEPAFPPGAVEVVRHRLIAKEAANTDRAWLTARRTLCAVLYGFNHPYTVALASPTADWERLRRDDVAQAWQEMLDPAATTLIVAGDVNPLVIRQSVATLFGGWKRHPAPPRAPAPIAPPEAPAGSGRIVAVDRPGARQATILYGGRLPDDSAGQNAARALIVELVNAVETRAANTAAGGEPGAVWDSWRYFPDAAFGWQKVVAPEQTRATLQELDGWLAELRARGPDASDLKVARARVTRSLPVVFETVEKIAETYADIVGSGRPLDWMEATIAPDTMARAALSVRSK